MRAMTDARITRLSPAQMAAMSLLRGTGRTKANGSLKTRFVGEEIAYVTLRSLRRKGLIDHLCAGQWYLTERGEEWSPR
jgi:hypothetical protein